MIGGAPGDAKLPVLEPPSALVKALPPKALLPPPKPPPPPNPPPPKAEGVEPLMVANGEGAEASLPPKLRVGLAKLGGAADALGVAAPRDANGDAEDAAAPPKTLCLAPAEAKGELDDEASLEKPEAANAADEVCVRPSLFVVSAVAESNEVGAWRSQVSKHKLLESPYGNRTQKGNPPSQLACVCRPGGWSRRAPSSSEALSDAPCPFRRRRP